MLHHIKWAEGTHYRFLVSCVGKCVSRNMGSPKEPVKLFFLDVIPLIALSYT